MSGNFNIFCHSLPYIEAPCYKFLNQNSKLKKQAICYKQFLILHFTNLQKKKKSATNYYLDLATYIDDVIV